MQVSEPKKIRRYYKALLDRDNTFLGTFFVGVRTTSIFCLPTCSARKPRFENVEFFTTFKDALDHGYRPCKVCKPTQNAFEAPEMVREALQLIQDQPEQKITDYALRQAGLSPSALRRWFQHHYGLTFQAYQRMFRINNAYRELKNGTSATQTAFDAGYDSLSGFGYTFRKIVGQPPKNAERQAIIIINRVTTPLGPMFVCASESGICLLEFVDRRALETEFRDLQRLLKAVIISGDNKHIIQLKAELKEYFEGKRNFFTVQLDTPGTPFQKRVWDELIEIPYGSTRSYQQQAEAINNPAAVRAVARANGSNRIAIVIPCHRVIGKDGNLTGYAGGLERKRWLLQHENAL